MMKKIIISIIALIIVIGGTLLFFTKKDEDSSLTKVTLSEVTHSIFYAPQYVAISEGFFEDEGIDIELISASGADAVTASVLSGDAYGAGMAYVRTSQRG